MTLVFATGSAYAGPASFSFACCASNRLHKNTHRQPSRHTGNGEQRAGLRTLSRRGSCVPCVRAGSPRASPRSPPRRPCRQGLRVPRRWRCRSCAPRGDTGSAGSRSSSILRSWRRGSRCLSRRLVVRGRRARRCVGRACNMRAEAKVSECEHARRTVIAMPTAGRKPRSRILLEVSWALPVRRRS